jgi:hypothetical protein
MPVAKEKPRSIQTARNDYARQWLEMNEGRDSPEDAGEWVHQRMQEEWGEGYPTEMALLDCVNVVNAVQKRAWVTARQGDPGLFGDSYLEANVKDVDGDLVKVKNVTSEFHDAEREEQISNLRKVNQSFERDEQRRSLLKEVGLWETEGMTTGQAAWKINNST